MRTEIAEEGLKIIPEGAQDIAYLRDSLGLEDARNRVVQIPVFVSLWHSSGPAGLLPHMYARLQTVRAERERIALKAQSETHR